MASTSRQLVPLSPDSFLTNNPAADEERLKARARLAFGEVVKYATSVNCRRARLLAHFGETLPEGTCTGCDSCNTPEVRVNCQ